MEDITNLTSQAFIPDVLNYLFYFACSILVVFAYLFIYLRVTRYDEFALMKEGNVAAAIALGGSMIGFGFTLAANAILHASVELFFIWAVIALLVQILSYLIASRLVQNLTTHIEENNVAMGLFVAAISIVFGIINVGALS